MIVLILAFEEEKKKRVQFSFFKKTTLPAFFIQVFSRDECRARDLGQGISEKLISLPKSEERRNKYARLKRRVKRICDPTLLRKDDNLSLRRRVGQENRLGAARKIVFTTIVGTTIIRKREAVTPDPIYFSGR